MDDHRQRPRFQAPEPETLLDFLAWHRDTLRLKTAGLGAAGLDTRLAPSTMTLGGMLKHLAWVEDWWFSVTFLGNEPAAAWADVDWDADGDWEWNSAADDSPDQLRAGFDKAVAASDTIVLAALPGGLDQTAARAGRGGHQPSLRWILVHMIEEYARHNGHADLIRESIDGQVGQ